MAITANLTVIKEYGGTTHWPNGSLLPVDLTCTADGIERPVQISVVLIKQLVSSPFFQELSAYETGAIAVTKLTNCTGQVAYVKEGRYDVDFAQNPCCSGTGGVTLSVNAGADKIVNLPENITSLSATTTPSTGIATVLWTQVSGPSTAVIDTPSQLNTDVHGLNQNGDYVFKVTVTDGDGNTAEDTVKVTVQDAVMAYWGWFDTDPFTGLHTSDSLIWQGSSPILDGANVVADYRTAPSEKFLGMKVTTGQPVKTTWFNTALNNGTIPDQVFQSMFTANGYDYYISRDTTTFDSSSTTTFS